jgi:hypothetical protein
VGAWVRKRVGLELDVTRFSRRLWLVGSLATIGGLGAFAAGAQYQWRRFTDPGARDLAALLRHRLGHLPLDSEGVDRFADEFVRRFGARPMQRHQELTLGGLLCFDAVLTRLPDERRTEIIDFERGLVGRYLLSTTYFRAPAGTLVEYVAFADPYETVCANPLAELGG